MAIRYSGRLIVRLTWSDDRNCYRGRVSRDGWIVAWVDVAPPPALNRAVDTVEQFDAAARACIAFAATADPDALALLDDCAFTLDGCEIHVGRSPGRRFPEIAPEIAPEPAKVA